MAATTRSAFPAVSLFVMPSTCPVSAASSAAAAWARSSLREPMITRWPASANRRARPRPWSPVPPRMPITTSSTLTVMILILPDARRAQTFGTLRVDNDAHRRGSVHYVYMDANQVATLRALLAPTGWLERTRVFAQGLRSATRLRGGLLVVGTPAEEPWHLTAHLDEESRLCGIPEFMPTLVRWQVPEGAPAHLRVGLERLEAARRGETLFVVSPATAPIPLLERVNDARRTGATIFALEV